MCIEKVFLCGRKFDREKLQTFLGSAKLKIYYNKEGLKLQHTKELGLSKLA